MSVTFVDGTTPLNAVNMNSLESKANKGQTNGYAALDGTGKVPQAQLPIPAVVNGQWIKGVGGAMVWSAIAATDVGYVGGVISTTPPGTGAYQIVTVTHGLGTTPRGVVIGTTTSGRGPGGTVDPLWSADSYSATTFRAILYAAGAATLPASAFLAAWIAFA